MTEKTLKLSWSRIRLHDECPQKGHLTSQGKRSKLTDSRIFFPGNVTDRCMRNWLSQEAPERGWMAFQVARIMDELEEKTQEQGDGVVKWKSAVDRGEVFERCTRAVTLLEDDLWTLLDLGGLRHPRDPALRFEVPIVIPYGGERVKIILHGEMDLRIRKLTKEQEPPRLVASAYGVEVWDLKTTEDDQYWRKTLGQLLFYEVATWGMTGSWPVRSGLLQPLCRERTPSWQFTTDDRMAMFQRITTVAGDILAGRVDPTPSASKCRYCDVRHACPAKGGGRGRTQLVKGS